MSDTAPEVAAAELADVLFSVEHVTLRFGGVTSLNDVSLGLAPRRDPVCHRPERRREDFVVQLPDRRLHAPGRVDHLHREERARRQRHRAQALQGEPARGGENVPDLPDVRCVDDLREREDRVESKQHTGPLGAMLRLPRTRREEHEGDLRTLELLKFVGLTQRANELSSSLPYGDRRRLEIARALGTNPEVLLLDEPSRRNQPG